MPSIQKAVHTYQTANHFTKESHHQLDRYDSKKEMKAKNLLKKF